MNYMNLFLTSFINILSETTSSGADYPGMPSGDSFIGKIIPNVWAFLVQILALIVLVIIFIIFAYKPVKKIIKKRQDFIQEQIDSAQNQNQEAEENLKQSQANIVDSYKKANQIIEDAKKQTLVEQQQIVDKTKQEIAKMKDDAQKDIELKKQAAQEEIKKEIIDVAFMASNELLKRETKTSDNEKLVEQFIEDIKKEDGSN